jgi:hypothetical protein
MILSLEWVSIAGRYVQSELIMLAERSPVI